MKRAGARGRTRSGSGRPRGGKDPTGAGRTKSGSRGGGDKDPGAASQQAVNEA